MSNELVQLLGTVIAGLLGVAGIIISLRPSQAQTKINQSQMLFNELQEERNVLKDEREELRGRLAKVEASQREAYRREFARDEFIQELRNHIRQGKGPPPPPWPEELKMK